MSYKIVRHYYNAGQRIIKRGLSLEEAQQHCRDSETSSKTCTTPIGRARTANRQCCNVVLKRNA